MSLSVSEVCKEWRLNHSLHTHRGVRLAVSQLAVTLFSWWASEDTNLAAQHAEWGTHPAGPWGKALIRSLYPATNSRHWIIHAVQLYSVSYLIHGRVWAWKQSFWSWGECGTKKLAVAGPSFDCSFSLSSNRLGRQFFLRLAKQTDNTKWQSISVWYMTSFSLWLCTAGSCKICWGH